MRIGGYDIPLPPQKMRWGGPRYFDDKFFIESSRNNIKALISECGLNKRSRLLDIGCGQARLLYGILNEIGKIDRYVGIDVHAPSISWLKENLEPILGDWVTFKHVNMKNERYNKAGEEIVSPDILGLQMEKYNIITLFSVFSHLMPRDIELYLDVIKDVLDEEKGRVYLTVFVEDGVEDVCENPPGYHREWKGSLHCVRYNRFYFEKMLIDRGLVVKKFYYRHTHDGQSSYIIEHKKPFWVD